MQLSIVFYLNVASGLSRRLASPKQVNLGFADMLTCFADLNTSVQQANTKTNDCLEQIGNDRRKFPTLAFV